VIVVFALLMPGLMLGGTMLLWQMENRLLGEREPEPFLGPVLVPDLDAEIAEPATASAPAPRQRSRAARPAGVVSAA
jgi:hypothetical protein